MLGSGTSHGVPMIGCDCAACTSPDPRDRRTNASLLVKVGERNILIDCGKDFRHQAVREGIRRIDHVLLTHTHFDHIGGIDDLRVFNHLQRDGIPLYALPDHLEYLRRYTYHYLFDPTVQRGGGLTDLKLVDLRGNVELEGLVFEPLPVFHGRLEILGFRFGDCAYISDVSHIPPATLERLLGLDVLILDALRFRPHSTHLCIDQALRLVGDLAPRRAFFTHLTHDVLHEEAEAGFRTHTSGYHAPSGVHLCYDGLTIQKGDTP